MCQGLEYSSGESGDGDSGELKFGTGDASGGRGGDISITVGSGDDGTGGTSLFKLVKQQVVPQAE